MSELYKRWEELTAEIGRGESKIQSLWTTYCQAERQLAELYQRQRELRAKIEYEEAKEKANAGD